MRTQPNRGTIVTIATAFLSSLSLLFGNGGAFYLVVRQPFDAGTNTYPLLYIAFLFCRIDTREDANTHKAISCKYLTNSICTVVEELYQDYFCPWILLFFDTLRPRVIDVSGGVAAWWSGFWARSLLSCWKLHWFPFEHWTFPLPLLTNTFSSFNSTQSLSILDHCSCFNSSVPAVKVSLS